MKKTILTLLLVALTTLVGAQTQKGGISEEMLKEIKKSYTGTGADKALMNVVTGNDLAAIAANNSNKVPFDTHFTYQVPSKGLTNQKSSGRCWLFTGLNVLRSQMINTYDLPALEFSQVYGFFWDQLEKANLFLQGCIDTADKPWNDQFVQFLFKAPISDGGTYAGCIDIIQKYGVVPKEFMVETYQSEATSKMGLQLKLKLREQGYELREMVANGAKAKALEAKKTEMLGVIYKMLVYCLGEPVTEFQWAPKNAKGELVGELKTYTPQSFYKEFFKEDLGADFIMVMNDPSRDYWKVYEIDYDRHSYDGHNWLYVNVPMEEMKAMAIESLKDNRMMYMSCDVSKFLNRERGLADLKNFDYESLFGTTFGMDKRQRILTRASGSTHAMTLMAVDIDADGNPIKWMVENSWGTTGYNGHLVMTDEWFDEYLFRLAVNKKYVPAKILDILKNDTPIMLPAWDPMFSADED